MLRKLMRLCAGLGLALMATYAHAQNTANTPQVQVLANVPNRCNVTTTAVDFGTYDPLQSSAINQAGSIVITCTKGANPTIGLGAGLSAVGGQRGMLKTGDATQRIPYDLFKPDAVGAGANCPQTGGTAWDNSTGGRFTVGAAPDKNARTVRVCGRTTQGLDVATGSYTDSVDVLITF